jgi:hypothetical protein
MPNLNIKTPDWLRHMESLLEELNEGVVIVDDQLRVVSNHEGVAMASMSSLGGRPNFSADLTSIMNRIVMSPSLA